MNLVYMFPGQGSQYPGMGKDLLDKSLFQKADEILGIPLSQMCFEGDTEDLKSTEITQPAILTHSLSLLKNYDLPKPDFVLGHSVGEYAALVCAKVLSFEEAVMAVHLRGKYMQEAAPEGSGKMAAILKMDQDIIDKVISENGSTQVSCANYNAPGQVVISGDAQGVDTIINALKETGKIFRAVELKVSAPFHCSLMKPAEEKLKEHFSKMTFNPLNTSYVANKDAKIYPPQTSGEVVCQNLVDQVCQSVLWTQSVQALPPFSAIEVGPGKVLKGLCRKIRSDASVLPLDNCPMDSLKEFLS